MDASTGSAMPCSRRGVVPRIKLVPPRFLCELICLSKSLRLSWIHIKSRCHPDRVIVVRDGRRDQKNLSIGKARLPQRLDISLAYRRLIDSTFFRIKENRLFLVCKGKFRPVGGQLKGEGFLQRPAQIVHEPLATKEAGDGDADQRIPPRINS